jgi:hypothetical protein
VVRAEACAADFYKALDTAIDKLERRFRQAADRRRVHHGRHSPTSVAAATGQLVDAATTLLDTPTGSVAVAEHEGAEHEGAEHEGAEHEGAEHDLDSAPLIVREKEHPAKPMTIDQALYEMELVGHDFYLFADSDSGFASVVYRRKGYAYGVLRLTD